MRRGNHAEIDIFPGEPIDNPLSGNVVDLCPVGALLNKDFLHKQRSWFLSKHDAICTRCSTGCNIKAEENRGEIWRFTARKNPLVNDFWICDEGRASYKAANDPNLLTASYVALRGDLAPATIDQAINHTSLMLRRTVSDGQKIVGVISPFLTVEEAYLMAAYLKGIDSGAVLALGPVPTSGEDRTFTPDQHKGRSGDTSFVVPRPFTIHAEKCPNRRGVEAILAHFQGEVIPFEAIQSRIVGGEFAACYFTSDAIDAWGTEEEARAIRAGVAFLIVQDTLVTPLAQKAHVVLSGATFAEKAGCYVNADGRLQYSGAALPPRDGSLPDLDIFAVLLGRPDGPIRSRDVLAELASTIPAFAAAEGGTFNDLGVLIGRPAETPAELVGVGGRFDDPWMVPRYLKGDRPGEPGPKGGKDA